MHSLCVCGFLASTHHRAQLQTLFGMADMIPFLSLDNETTHEAVDRFIAQLPPDRWVNVHQYRSGRLDSIPEELEVPQLCYDDVTDGCDTMEQEAERFKAAYDADAAMALLMSFSFQEELEANYSAKWEPPARALDECDEWQEY